MSCLVGEAIPVLQQAREIGITQPIVGGNGFNSPAVLKNAKSAAEGLIVGSAWFIDSTAPKSRAFVAAFRKAYGADPTSSPPRRTTGCSSLPPRSGRRVGRALGHPRFTCGHPRPGRGAGEVLL